MKLENIQKVQILTVTEDRAGQRIDNLLLGLLKGVPKTHIYRLLRKGEVRVNKGRIKADYRLVAGDLLRLPPLRLDETDKPAVNATLNHVQKLDTTILELAKEWLVINKPTGYAVHGGSGLSFGVVEGLRALHPEWHYLELVHRIDRETSGILLMARKRSALRQLHEQLREHKMSKKYLCLVHGDWPDDLYKVSAPLFKSSGRGGERIMIVSQSGQESLTKFKVIARYGHSTLLQAEPVTGRTHQIRVHCQHAGFPIVGDPKYLPSLYLQEQEQKWQVNRLMLHAAKLKFVLNEITHQVRAPLDKEFNRLLNTLGYPPELIEHYLGLD